MYSFPCTCKDGNYTIVKVAQLVCLLSGMFFPHMLLCHVCLGAGDLRILAWDDGRNRQGATRGGHNGGRDYRRCRHGGCRREVSSAAPPATASPPAGGAVRKPATTLGGTRQDERQDDTGPCAVPLLIIPLLFGEAEYI